MQENERLILVTNDDGINSKGIKALVEIAKKYGKVVVVAPKEAQSGMSHAITVKIPIRVYKETLYDSIPAYACNGTPVDCVKMAINTILPRKPDLVLSGINHGANSSSSVLYSGTMAAAIEGCLNGIPAIGLSYLDISTNADFSVAQLYADKIINSTLKYGMAKGVCLNVNIPALPAEKIVGIKICRQNHGVWKEEFEHRKDPNGFDYYWLTGTFEDLEPHAEETDEWALRNNYVTIVPVQFDLTAYSAIPELKKWTFDE
jgi:5'-nucleotidase